MSIAIAKVNFNCKFCGKINNVFSFVMNSRIAVEIDFYT